MGRHAIKFDSVEYYNRYTVPNESLTNWSEKIALIKFPLSKTVTHKRLIGTWSNFVVDYFLYIDLPQQLLSKSSLKLIDVNVPMFNRLILCSSGILSKILHKTIMVGNDSQL